MLAILNPYIANTFLCASAFFASLREKRQKFPLYNSESSVVFILLHVRGVSVVRGKIFQSLNSGKIINVNKN